MRKGRGNAVGKDDQDEHDGAEAVLVERADKRGHGLNGGRVSLMLRGVAYSAKGGWAYV